MNTVVFPASYIAKIADCLEAHSITVLRRPTATKNYLTILAAELKTALENGEAAQARLPNGDSEGITVEWCEANMAFAVMDAGKAIECFPTRKEAEAHANELATGGVTHGEANTAARAC